MFTNATDIDNDQKNSIMRCHIKFLLQGNTRTKDRTRDRLGIKEKVMEKVYSK